MKNPFKKDVQINIKGKPDSIDFKFFDKLHKQNNGIIIEIRKLKNSINKLRRIAKLKIIVISLLISFIITTFLAAITEYEEFVLNLLGGPF